MASELPTAWWADTDGEAQWFRRRGIHNQEETLWCDDAGEAYLNALEARATRAEEKYMRLVEHTTTILRVVRKSEGEQLSNEEIAARVVNLAKAEADADRVPVLEAALAVVPDDIDWLMEIISGLESFAYTHGYKPDVEDILRGTEIRARANELRAALTPKAQP